MNRSTASITTALAKEEKKAIESIEKESNIFPIIGQYLSVSFSKVAEHVANHSELMLKLLDKENDKRNILLGMLFEKYKPAALHLLTNPEFKPLLNNYVDRLKEGDEALFYIIAKHKYDEELVAQMGKLTLPSAVNFERYKKMNPPIMESISEEKINPPTMESISKEKKEEIAPSNKTELNKNAEEDIQNDIINRYL